MRFIEKPVLRQTAERLSLQFLEAHSSKVAPDKQEQSFTAAKRSRRRETPAHRGQES
jgi:hypothetical protein